MLARILKNNFSVKYTGLERWGIKHHNIHYNPSISECYSDSLSSPTACEYNTRDSVISSTGALCAYSGLRYGRSPIDKRVVNDSTTKNDIWWSKVNMPISTESNRFCRDVAIKYLNTKDKLYVVDGYAGWDPLYRLKCRIVCSRPYHALFMKNMLIKPT
jgi:phosphoenolpyruvate carboxykinase (ATP)